MLAFPVAKLRQSPSCDSTESLLNSQHNFRSFGLPTGAMEQNEIKYNGRWRLAALECTRMDHHSGHL